MTETRAMTLPAQSSAVVVDPAFLERLHVLRQTLAPNLNDGELELFALVATRKGLDPFSGQIMAVKRNSRNGARVTYQTGIDGYRSIAARTDEYLGSDEPEYGPPCDCPALPAGHPLWARVVVRRWHAASGQVVAQPGKADWHEFVPTDDFMWREKPRLMLAKCAEAQGLRKAFPWVLGDLYIPEEMARGDDGGTPAVPPAVTARESVAAKAAALRGDSPLPAQGAAEDDTPAAPAPAAQVITEDPAASLAEAEPMTANQFLAAISAAGISKEQVTAAGQSLFPGRKSAELTPQDWGDLYVNLTGGA